MSQAMRVSVLVPSYRRPKDLARCLAALEAQSQGADRVVVVTRTNDFETLEITKSWEAKLPLCIVHVDVPGVVQAMNAGLKYCNGDIVAITDDDAAPRTDWLAQIMAHFAADPKLGGVGGRDWIHRNGEVETGSSRRVGQILWYGRIVGNHHLGGGPARNVDVLKGVNCAFRMAALGQVGFETGLLGEGAQVHWELCLCFAVKRKGWRLVYDPAIAVDHFPAQRFDKDERNRFDARAAANRIFNFRVAVGSGLPMWRRLRVVIWYSLIGAKDDPGVFRRMYMAIRRDQIGLSRHRSVRHLLAKKH
jgi:cellulose synthase/poly-beta-1,6-N-acetylglucosamine synthase-like glycosyltransferase